MSDRDHSFRANQGGRAPQPVAEGYAEVGQTRDAISIGRKVITLGCLVPFLCAVATFLADSYTLIFARLREGQALFQPVPTAPPPGMEAYYPLPVGNLFNIQVGIVIFLTVALVLYSIFRIVRKLARR